MTAKLSHKKVKPYSQVCLQSSFMLRLIYSKTCIGEENQLLEQEYERLRQAKVLSELSSKQKEQLQIKHTEDLKDLIYFCSEMLCAKEDKN